MSQTAASPEPFEYRDCTPWVPRDDRDKEAVREQVGRIVSSALFRNSRRFPAFLRYTAEHALTSQGALKERTIGHEVFGRDPAYDTSQDPIVRMTATEVRKRLGQYYQSPEHAAETIVAYQPGSYVPEFFVRADVPVDVVPEAAVAPPPTARRSGWGMPLLLLAAVALAGVLLAVAPSRQPSRVVDLFWAVLLDAASPVLVCIGDPSPPRNGALSPGTPPGDATIDEFLQANSVRYTDSVTLALVSAELRARGKSFRIRRPAATELKDLREGPVVLIGGFNNPWTLKLNEGLRFTLASDDNGSYIRDAEHPSGRDWRAGTRSARLKDISQTYGLITRVRDPATGHAVLTLSGLMLGTRAAAECVLAEPCLSAAAPPGVDWTEKNVQIVVAAAVIGEDSGAPRIVATHFW